MSDYQKDCQNQTQECKKNLPVLAPTTAAAVVTSKKEEEEEEVIDDEKVRLNADEEARLKKNQYAHGQPTHAHQDIAVKSSNMHRNNGRDHGNLQIQSRAQNH